VAGGGTAQERIDALARMLHHYDTPQLSFQLAEIAGERTYLRHGVTVEPGDVVLDVGANVGVAAAFFAAQCGAGLVHCFEPVPALAALLRENVAALPACVVHEHALSRAPGRLPLTYYPGAAAMSGLYADPRRDAALVRTVLVNSGVHPAAADERLAGAHDPIPLTCKARTLSSVLEDLGLARVDLLKIDVERAELDVLAGLAEDDWATIAQIVVEVHDEDGRCAALADALDARGFRVVREQEPLMRGTDVHMVYATR
jgi:31-O-methyltransferase